MSCAQPTVVHVFDVQHKNFVRQYPYCNSCNIYIFSLHHFLVIEIFNFLFHFKRNLTQSPTDSISRIRYGLAVCFSFFFLNVYAFECVFAENKIWIFFNWSEWTRRKLWRNLRIKETTFEQSSVIFFLYYSLPIETWIIRKCTAHFIYRMHQSDSNEKYDLAVHSNRCAFFDYSFVCKEVLISIEIKGEGQYRSRHIKNEKRCLATLARIYELYESLRKPSSTIKIAFNFRCGPLLRCHKCIRL